MKLLVIGYRGAIGRRWMTCARHLQIPVTGWDILDQTDPPVDAITHCLIATPTTTHYGVFMWASEHHWSIMVEKPMTMDLNESYIMGCMAGFVVNNWSLVHPDKIYKPRSCTIEYRSHYTGPHGEPWDTCQLEYLCTPGQRPRVVESPVWGARINGRHVSYKQLELSYLTMLDAFVHDRRHELWTLAQGEEMTKICLNH